MAGAPTGGTTTNASSFSLNEDIKLPMGGRYQPTSSVGVFGGPQTNNGMMMDLNPESPTNGQMIPRGGPRQATPNNAQGFDSFRSNAGLPPPMPEMDRMAGSLRSDYNDRGKGYNQSLSPEAMRFLRESDDPRARLLRDQAIPQPVSQQAQQSIAQQYMNPYVNAALQPQLDELRRQSEISRVQQAGRLTQAGAYGGSRQALADVELSRGMLANMANVTGQGYNQAYQQAQSQFNTEQQQGQQSQNFANQFGLQALANQIQAGQLERNIEQEGITADRLQFEEERDFPYKQVQYQQSLLQGLPIAAQSYNYAQPSALSDFLSGSGGVYDLLGKVFLPQEEATTDTTGTEG